MKLPELQLVESEIDEEYINSDEFKEYCRLMDEALAQEEQERAAKYPPPSEWCKERECISFYFDMRTGSPYPCPHRQVVS